MTSPRRRPARDVRRWLGLLLISITSTTLLTPLLTSGGAAAAPLETELRLNSLSPISVQDGATVRASGSFTSNRTVDDVIVRFEVGNTPFSSRSSIAEAAANPPFTSAVFGADDDLRKVRKGDTEQFTIKFPAEDLPLSASGVYPIRVAAFDADGEQIASVSSFLPWAPEPLDAIPTRLLMIWPLIGDSELATLPAASADAEVQRDELLTGSLEGPGRLATLVRAGELAPATWVVDPAIIDQAAELGTGPAHDWLESVATEAKDRTMVALPYGDPDVAAVGAAGRPGFLVQGQTKGDRVFSRVLGAEPRTDFSWPADGAGDEQTISVSGRAGDAFVLLDNRNAPLVTPPTYTPSGRIAWSDPELDVLLADGPASALVASPASTASDVLLARQRFLAETYLHSLENPFAQRLLVVAPPRRWDPSELWADQLVQAIRHARWLNPVTLDEAVKPSPPPFARETPSIPNDSADHQLSAGLVFAAQDALVDNRRLAAILTRPEEVAPPIEDELFTSVSTAWRSDPAAAETAQQATLDRLSSLRGGVRILSGGGTLADDRGSFPVTLRNELDQRVVVRLAVTTTDQLRLRVTGPDEEIKIGPDRSRSMQVDLDAVTSGRLSFEAQLETPGGAPYSEPVTIAVDVRGYGQVTLLVFGAAVALLILAAGIRLFRRIRAARRGAT
jgi:hypothetical protein